MKIMDTERIICPKCKVELDVPIYQCDEKKKYGMKCCHQCGTKLILNAEDEEIIRSVREGTKAMYNYTEEQVSAYWQGVEDCAKENVSSRDKKCDLEILRGINGTAVTINGYRVTSWKIYGMLVTEAHYKINISDAIHAICKEG